MCTFFVQCCIFQSLWPPWCKQVRSRSVIDKLDKEYSVSMFSIYFGALFGGLQVPSSLQPSSYALRYLLKKSCQEKSKFYKFISKRRIISLMHSSVLRRIWLNFMAQYLGFFGSFIVFTIFRISYFFGLSTTDETWLVEMHIWCIKIGIVLVLYLNKTI
jgi:hypothetical protein